MIGSLISQKTMRTFCTALAAALAMLVAGPLAAAQAAGPTLSIESPAFGARIAQPEPTIAGTSSDSVDQVSISLSKQGGSQVLSESVLPTAGAWSIKAPALGDGTYTALVSQTDSTSGEATNAQTTFTVDTTAPAVTLAHVASPSRSRTLGGSIGTVPGDLAAVTVTIYAGESPAGSIVETASASVSGGSWAYSLPTSLPDGTYTVQATQQDEAGNVGQSAPDSFTLDTVPPTVTLSQLPTIVGTATPSFSGTAGQTSASATSSEDLPAVKLDVYSGTAASGSVLGSAKTTASGGDWTVSLSKALADGTYTAIAEQADRAGNVGTSVPAVTFTVKTKGPAVSLDLVPTWIANPSPIFAGDIGSAAGDEPAVLFELHRGTSALGSQATAPVQATIVGSRWSAGPVTPLEDGTYTAVAKQSDQAKNMGLSIARTFTIDTLAPRPTLAVPPSGSTGMETVSGTAGIATSDRKQVTAELFQGAVAEPGQAVESITVNASSTGSWSATFAALGGGEYTVLARQSDEAGNVGESPPQSFSVAAPSPVAPPAASPPVASFTWVPANPAVGERVSLASNSSGGSSLLSGFGWDVGSGQFAPGGPLLTTSFTTPGPHVVRLQVTDASGLSSIATHTIGVAVQALKLMQPFPIVRIAGSETSSGARITLLSVQAPPATKVGVSCKGPGCKTKAESRIATASRKSRSKAGAIVLSFPRFQRALRAGAVLQIRVSKTGEIGKFTSFTIRRNKVPTRIDACLRPPSSTPSPCPSS